MAPIRLAFAGITHPHADAWATAAHAHPEVQIAAVFDPDTTHARAFADQYGCAVLPQLELGSAGIDAVVIDGRNDQAQQFAMAAVHAGLPVFLEKTGGRTSAELDSVAAAAEARHLLTQMGYFLRYSDTAARIQAALKGQELGRVSLARFHAAIPHGAWQSMRHWFGDPSNVVGPFTEAGCHMIDIVRLLFGEPTSVAATAVNWHTAPNHAEDALAVSMTCGDVVVALDFTAHEANPWNTNWTVEVYGTRGSLRAGLTPARYAINSGHHTWETQTTVRHDSEEDHQRVAAAENVLFMKHGMDAFVDAIRGRGAVPVDARSGANTLRLIEEILHSAAGAATAKPADYSHHRNPSNEKKANNDV